MRRGQRQQLLPQQHSAPFVTLLPSQQRLQRRRRSSPSSNDGDAGPRSRRIGRHGLELSVDGVDRHSQRRRRQRRGQALPAPQQTPQSDRTRFENKRSLENNREQIFSKRKSKFLM